MAEKKSGAIKIDWKKKEAQFSPNIKLTSKKNQMISNSKTELAKETVIRFEIISDKIEDSDCQTYSFEVDKISEIKPINLSNPWYFDFTGDTFITDKSKTPLPKEKFQEKVSHKMEVDEGELVKPSSLFDSTKKPVPEAKSTPAPPKLPPLAPTEVKPTPAPSINPPHAPTEVKPTPAPSIKPPLAPTEVKPAPQHPLAPQKKPSDPTPLFETLHKSAQEAPSSYDTPSSSRVSTLEAATMTTRKSPTSSEIVDKSLPVPQQIEQLEEKLASTRNIILTLDKRLSAGLFNLPEYLEKKNFLIKKIENIKTEIEKLKKH
jgi:hypothetical protein